MFSFLEGPYELTGFMFSKVYADVHQTVGVVMTNLKIQVCL